MAEGPDRIIPTDDLTTWEQDGATKIRMGSEYPANIEPKSLVTVINEACSKGGDRTAYMFKDANGKMIHVSYKDYFRDIKIAAKAFIKLGLEPLKSVAINGFNSPEWFMSDLGSIYAGGMVSRFAYQLRGFWMFLVGL